VVASCEDDDLCFGEPAVVLEAGLNNGAASWQRVMPLLAQHMRIAVYDRAGLGGRRH
jgi:hypothetical protein